MKKSEKHLGHRYKSAKFVAVEPFPLVVETETYHDDSPTRHSCCKSPDDDPNGSAVGAEKTPVESKDGVLDHPDNDYPADLGNNDGLSKELLIQHEAVCVLICHYHAVIAGKLIAILNAASSVIRMTYSRQRRQSIAPWRRPSIYVSLNDSPWLSC